MKAEIISIGSEILRGQITDTNANFIAKKLVESNIEMVVSINGKVRDKIIVNIDTSKDEIIILAKSRTKIQELIEGKEIRKIIVVPKKLVNIVV